VICDLSDFELLHALTRTRFCCLSHLCRKTCEFELTNSEFNKVFTKPERLAFLRQQQKAGAPPAIPAPVTSARIFNFGEAVVLKQYQTMRNGKHDVNTRMWTKRGGRWQLLFAFETIG